ncbi:SDR family NAD(P)-dependent oxidoreductase [Falsigemmobacter intermedius]|nr:SDR family NAD(P)-dependent oxidoreductase [Falsigemmobacter intermedius]
MEDRIAIVTGAARGIGRAIVEKFAAEGFRLVLNDLSEDELQACLQDLNARGIAATGLAGSVREADLGERLLALALGEYGRADVFVNNAGFATYAPAEDYPDDEFDLVVDTLVSAPFRLLKPFGRYLRDTAGASAQARRIINIASVAGLRSAPGQVSYGVGKAGIISLTQTLSREWGRFGVTVNAVCPGLIRTRLTEAKAGVDTIEVEGRTIPLRGMNFDDYLRVVSLGRAGEPEDIAGAVWLLARPEAGYIHGQSLVVDGGGRA